MDKRVSIMIDTDLDRKLRLIQAKQIRESYANVTFSKVVNETLRKGLEK